MVGRGVFGDGDGGGGGSDDSFTMYIDTATERVVEAQTDRRDILDKDSATKESQPGYRVRIAG